MHLGTDKLPLKSKFSIVDEKPIEVTSLGFHSKAIFFYSLSCGQNESSVIRLMAKDSHRSRRHFSHYAVHRIRILEEDAKVAQRPPKPDEEKIK